MSYSVYNTVASGDGNAPTREGIAVTGATTYYSQIWSGHNADGHTLTVIYSGTPTGTLTLWMTDDYSPDLTTDSDWVQDTGFSPTNPAGAAGKFRDDTSTSKAQWKRLKYVNASGAGTLFTYVSTPHMS